MCLHYLVKLTARVLSPYITYFSIQTVDCWHQIFTNCWNNSFQQLTTVSVVFTDMENHAGEGLQQGEDCKCWRTSPAYRGRVGTSWSAHCRRRNEGMAKTTATECCCWRRTVWTWTMTPDATVLLHCALWLCRLIVWLLITFDVTVFSVLWLFQSHAAVVKRYNTFCVKLTANGDTEQNNISKSTFPVCVSEYFYI